ncbi:hypothetical protein U8527_15815 [Kordia algicida OT-1]|uniref:Uncharacterized protein n=1 Tax=Kordia algicida OT-1 TaxID=391587 RepID=A9E3X9_9FLAO|nr:hypothetical protein [Kordia algicida]EDP95286.1 hypothetical protein KAOT1_09446 [Kordia algicida OT-1]
METLHVIRNTFIIILIFIMGAHAQENDTDYFKLHKDGQKIKKKQIYLKLNQNFKKSVYDVKETYVYKDKFVFTNTGKKCTKEEKVIYSNVEDLYSIEKKVLEEHMLEIQKKYGFKPVYPLNHVALKILLIKEDNCFVLNWKRQ